MSKTLIVGEVQAGALREATFELVSLARKLGGELVSLLMGNGIQAQAEELSKKGGGKVLVADNAALEHYTADAYAQVIRQAVEAESPDLILISNTPSGWDVAPKLAAALDAGIITDVFSIEEDGGDLVFIRRLFNGKFDGRFRLSGSPRVATVQPGAIAAYEGSEPGSIESLETSPSSRTQFVELRTAAAGGHDLTKAEIIISGGRGLAKPENFESVLKPLVDALGAQMGASRPVVDSGWLIVVVDRRRGVGSVGRVHGMRSGPALGGALCGSGRGAEVTLVFVNDLFLRRVFD